MTGPERDREMREVAREVLRELMPGVLREAVDGNGEGNGHRAGSGNGHRAGSGHGHGAEQVPRASAGAHDEEVIPQVPAPPVAAVLRPSTWDRPAAPGEIIGAGAAAAPAGRPAPPLTPPRAARLESPPARQAPPPEAQPVRAASPPAPREAGKPARIDTGGDGRVEVVAIDTDEDLTHFIRQLMSRLENPRERLAIRTGRLRFQLRRAPGAAVAGGARPAGPATRVQKGAVTERMIRAAAAEGSRLVLGPGAVLTPLAREQARARGVEIERERPC